MEVVVGVAVVREGRVLAARRTRPAAVAGRWELPGGKVERGESDAAACVREVAEELGCTVEVVGRLPGEARISERHVLRVHVARLVEGEPVPVEHDQVRWLRHDELDQVDWLPADRPFVDQLRHELVAGDPAEGLEAYLDERDAADELAHRLSAEGHAATVRRESFAGEDDSDDRPWVVLVQGAAAAHRLDELVADREDGWIVPAAPAAGQPTARPTTVSRREPPPLPTAPRR